MDRSPATVPPAIGPLAAGSPRGTGAVPRGGSGEMFDRIARRYDLLNRVLSFGVDRRWRRRAVAALALAPGARVLDVATGTADVVLEVLRQEPTASVVGVDPSREMLRIGREKLARKGAGMRAELAEGDGEALPFADGGFDGVAIAFGIRNIPDRDRALAEMARVTRPGGRVVVLELCEPRGLLALGARLWVHRLVPWIGALLSGAREYRYLERSIAAFPPPEEFARRMGESGLEVLRVEPLTCGAACLFVGGRPHPAGRPGGSAEPQR